MPRPRKCRMISGLPGVRYFKPRGVPLRDLAEVYLPLECFEALRLADVQGLNQEQAAESMGVSRQTFGRILARARQAVAEAVVGGLALRIEGGDFALCRGGGGEAGLDSKVRDRDMNKIAVSSEGPTLDDQVDPRFGRAAGFIVVDVETMEFEYLDNGSSQIRGQGAGIGAAEIVARAGAGVVLTGFVGPKAFSALSAAGIRIGQDLEGLTVRQAVEKFKAGEVRPADRPNRAGGGRR